jgi:hypothetical protein
MPLHLEMILTFRDERWPKCSQIFSDVKDVSIIIRLSTVSSLLVFLKKLLSLSESVTLEEMQTEINSQLQYHIENVKKNPHH